MKRFEPKIGWLIQKKQSGNLEFRTENHGSKMPEILSNEISHNVERIPRAADITPIVGRGKKEGIMISNVIPTEIRKVVPITCGEKIEDIRRETKQGTFISPPKTFLNKESP
jgi:hypothetical protein